MARHTKAAVETARQVAGIMAYADDDTAPIPTEPVVALGGELVKATKNGRSDRAQKYADLTTIVHGAETLRFDAQITVGLETELDAASDVLAVARAQEANREHVNPEIIRQLMDHTTRWTTHLESWLLQRGITDDGAGVVTEREDVNGHLIDEDNKLIYDPRCYFCLNSDPDKRAAYVRAEIDAEGGVVTIVSLINDSGVYLNVTVASTGLDAAKQAKAQLIARNGDRSWRVLKYRSAS